MAKCCFENANVTSASFVGCVLSSTSFKGAVGINTVSFDAACDLSGANFVGCCLARQDFTKASLVRADLSNCDLSGVNLSNCDLSNAILTNANLARASMTGCDLTTVDLLTCDMTDAVLIDAVVDYHSFLPPTATYNGVKFKLPDVWTSPPSGANYTLSGSGNVVATKTGGGNSYNCNITGRVSVSQDVHSWKVKVIDTRDSDIIFGVAPSKDLVHNASNQHSQCGFYLNGYGTLFSSKKAAPNSDSTSPPQLLQKGKIKTNDVVTIVLDCDRKTLSFGINSGDTVHECYTSIPADQFPMSLAVILVYDKSSVELVEYKRIK